MLCSPQVELPSVPLHHYYNIIDCIHYAMLFLPVTYSFHDWKLLSPSPLHPFCPPAPSNHQFSVCIALILLFTYSFFKIPFMSGIIWYLSFSVWLISLSIISCRSKHVVSNGTISYILWLCNTPFVCVCVCVYCIFLIHLSVDGRLGCLHVLAVVNNAAINIGVHISLQVNVFPGQIPNSGVSDFLFG